MIVLRLLYDMNEKNQFISFVVLVKLLQNETTEYTAVATHSQQVQCSLFFFLNKSVVK